MTLGPFAESEYSTFAQFFQLRDKLRPRQVSVVLPKFLSIAIENNEGWKAKHIVLACEVQVLLLQLSGLRLRPRPPRPWKVELKKNKILPRIIFKISRRKNVVVQANPPAA